MRLRANWSDLRRIDGLDCTVRALALKVAICYLTTMPQPVKLSDPLINAARTVAPEADRSIAGQIEHWARLGRVAERVLTFDESAHLKRDDFATPSADLALASAAIDQLRDAVREEEPPTYDAMTPSGGWPTWVEQRREGIEALCRLAGVHRLAFVGSVLGERFDRARGSDVDVIVEFNAEPTPSARRYFDFRAALAQLLGAPVDLVELEAMPGGRLKRALKASQRTFYVEAS